MNAKLSHRMCIVVLGAALCLQTSAVMAGIVATDELAAPNQTEMEKAKIQTFIDRADVRIVCKRWELKSPWQRIELQP